MYLHNLNILTLLKISNPILVINMNDQLEEHMRNSKSSIVDAIRELALAKSAFARSDRLEENQSLLFREIESIKEAIKGFLPYGIYELGMRDLEKKIQVKGEDILEDVQAKLDGKIDSFGLENALKFKVGYSEFTSLSRQILDIKSKFERHLYSDFEALK